MLPNSHSAVPLRSFVGTLALGASCIATAAARALDPDPPVRYYGTEAGLNQAWGLTIAIDAAGYVWGGTFAGLNRFDGKTMQSFTTEDGLRDNFVQNLYLDQYDRVWAGDSSGGLTRFDNGKLAANFDPPPGGEGRIVALAQLGDTLYIGRSPGGLSRLALSADAQIEVIEGGPLDFLETYPLDDGRMLVLTEESGAFFYAPATNTWTPLNSPATLTKAAILPNGTVYVGDRDGRVGVLNGQNIDWLATNYKGFVSALLVRDGQLAWVGTPAGMTSFQDPDLHFSHQRQLYAAFDPEGVLWTVGDDGLGRYLGARFKHYTIAVDGNPLRGFSLHIDQRNRFWFGSNAGLILIDEHGAVRDVSQELSLPKMELREIVADPDGKTLWLAFMDDFVYRVNTDEWSASVAFPKHKDSFANLLRDPQGVLWAGSYNSRLHRFDPRTGDHWSITLGDNASIYAMAVADDGTLWFAANFDGLYRLSTTDPQAAPERVFDARDEYRTVRSLKP